MLVLTPENPELYDDICTALDAEEFDYDVIFGVDDCTIKVHHDAALTLMLLQSHGIEFEER